MSELTKKQESFCQMVLQSSSFSEAYRKAYDTSQMKDTTINRKAFELIENGKITARIDELKQERNQRINYNADSFLLELLDMLDADILEIFDPDRNCILPITDWPPVWKKLVTNFSQKPVIRKVKGEKTVIGYRYSISTISKVRILHLIGRHTAIGAF